MSKRPVLIGPVFIGPVFIGPVFIGPVFIGSEIYRGSSYGSKHPLAIPRVSMTIDLCRAMGWLPDAAYRDSPMATPDQLARFHDPAYIAALMRAEAEQRVDEETARRHDIGRRGNPVFPEVFRRPATAAGASLLAARLLLDGVETVYSPAGGTHHGRHDRASGFCYFNDPVLGILALLDGGMDRVLYVDLDAHHGDGVEAAFAGDPRVLTLSVHEENRWPFTGRIEDRADGSARNLPVPVGFNDDELAYVVEHALLPLGHAFAPQALVVQCGADALADDPLSRLDLSNGALWAAVAALAGLAPRRMVLGGGGYNPWSVGRCWAGVWATLNGIDPAVVPTPRAEALLRAITWERAGGRNPPERWFVTLADPPNRGPVRDGVRRAVASVVPSIIPEDKY